MDGTNGSHSTGRTLSRRATWLCVAGGTAAFALLIVAASLTIVGLRSDVADLRSDLDQTNAELERRVGEPSESGVYVVSLENVDAGLENTVRRVGDLEYSDGVVYDELSDARTDIASLQLDVEAIIDALGG